MILFLSISPILSAQINDGTKYISILKGQTYIDTIESNNPLAPIIVENCFASAINIGNKKRQVTIASPQSNPNYVGTAKAYTQYTDGLKPRYISWEINFVESKIATNEDFVVFNSTDTIEVLPLLNDITTANGLKLVGLGNVQGGNAWYSNNQINFIPDADIERAFIQYAVKDTFGTVANGLIHFIKDDANFVSTDTLKYTLLNTRHQNIILPAEGFTLLSTPLLGSVSSVHPRVLKYIPTKSASGTDTFILVDSGNNTRVVEIKLIHISQNTSSVRDDKFYTPKNTPITFDVFANDLSSNFPIINYSPALVRDTLGIFTYTPPSGFSGVSNFTYKVNYGQYQVTGKITIVVGNFTPLTTQDYTFNTIKNESLVVNYDVPVNGYHFNVLNQPNFGIVEVFENTLVGEGCDTLMSKATIIYTPDNNYYGNDSFDIEYCILNNPCIVQKVAIQIYNVAPDTLCHCKGSDCVWPGDLNGDGRVSVRDILSIGRFGGLSGASRSDIASPFWSGQKADDWSYTHPNGLNIKHVDANGDGLISSADTSAISSYYATVHTFVPEEVLAIKDYPFNLIPNSTELDSGDLLILDIEIGDATKDVVDLFGLAFGLNVSPLMIDSSSLSVQFDKFSWFADNSPTLQMYKQPKEGNIHTAFTRTASIVEDEVEGFKPVGVAGNGIIGRILFIVEDEVEGFKTNDNFITRRISTNGIEVQDADGERYIVPDTYVDVRINLNKKEIQPTEDKLIVYPNPARDNVLLHFNGRNEIKAYRIYDQMGMLINNTEDINAQSTQFNTNNYLSGIYMLQVVTTQGTISKKLIVSPK